ncbi:MAG: hypothetical protein PF961_09940 [Planctomycetota bacterium]|jgi:hypothetical protein|nr:hypothetical protein [Planctomycetota bacterium]
MSLELLFYEPEGDAPTQFDDIATVLAAELGCELPDHGDYRPWRWRDPRTGSVCQGDLGTAPLEQDQTHDDKGYAGWRRVPLNLQIPLGVAHWQCVECGNLCDRLLKALPGTAVLNVEDGGDGDEDMAPGPLDRIRLLATWEQLHIAQCAGRDDVWRMDRRSSLALWRYRREIEQGRGEQADLTWPGALALLDGSTARSATFWADPSADLALPPVELLVIRRPNGDTGVLPADDLIAAAKGGTTLGSGAATRIASSEATRSLFAEANLLPAERFRALDDQEWSD